MLDGVESGGAIIWIQGQIRVAHPMKLVDGVHYSATELHSRSGCHVKQRDTAAEVTHAHTFYQAVQSGAFYRGHGMLSSSMGTLSTRGNGSISISIIFCAKLRMHSGYHQTKK